MSFTTHPNFPDTPFEMFHNPRECPVDTSRMEAGLSGIRIILTRPPFRDPRASDVDLSACLPFVTGRGIVRSSDIRTVRNGRTITGLQVIESTGTVTIDSTHPSLKVK